MVAVDVQDVPMCSPFAAVALIIKWIPFYEKKLHLIKKVFMYTVLSTICPIEQVALRKKQISFLLIVIIFQLVSHQASYP